MTSETISRESRGLLYLLLSAFLFSMMGAFLKIVTGQGMPSTELVFFRAAFQGLFVVLGMLRFRTESLTTSGSGSSSSSSSNCSSNCRDSSVEQQDQDGRGSYDHTSKLLIQIPFGTSKDEKKVVIVRGIVGGGFGFICYFYSIKTLPLGDAVTLFSIYPIYTIFMAKYILHEEVTWNHIVLTCTNLLGGILIAGPSFLVHNDQDESDEYPDKSTSTSTSASMSTAMHDEQYNPLGYATAIAGGFFAASVVILIRKAGTMGTHTLQLLFSWCCFGLLSSIIFGFTVGKTVEGPWIWPTQWNTWLCILATLMLGTAAHFLLNYAGRLAPAGLCAIVRSTDILWAYLIEVLVFRQVPTTTTIVGVFLILFSLTMIALEKLREDKESKTYNVVLNQDEADEEEYRGALEMEVILPTVSSSDTTTS